MATTTNRKRRSMKFESMEPRQLMAADISLDNGLLRVEGTESADVISIEQVQVAFPTIERVLVTNPLTGIGQFQFQSVFRNSPRVQVTIAETNGAVVEQAQFIPSAVEAIEVRSLGGNDTVENETGIGSTQYGGYGNDVLRGGSVRDVLYGESGNDQLIGNAGNDGLYGSYGNDTLEGGSGDDSLYGSYGNDSILGGSGADYLSGSDGNDVLEGGSGNDTLYAGAHNDVLRGDSGSDDMFGGSGNDNLYGGSGEDYLNGESGDDGLFGGTGEDQLRGSTGDDRFLVLNDVPVQILGITVGHTTNDAILDRASSDARVNFEHGEGRRFDFSGGRWSELADGAFTDAEIERVDQALADLHHQTHNTKLLKQAGGGELLFERLGPQIDGNFNVGGINSGGSKIILLDASFTSDNWLAQVVFHEVGHNWDDENANWGDWKNISGWRNFFWFWESKDAYTESGDGEWWYLDGTTFASNYAKTNPKEDFAEYFAKVMMEDSGRNFSAGGENTNAAKQEFMDDFFASLV
jgi:hypothetical protein